MLLPLLRFVLDCSSYQRGDSQRSSLENKEEEDEDSAGEKEEEDDMEIKPSHWDGQKWMVCAIASLVNLFKVQLMDFVWTFFCLVHNFAMSFSPPTC
jgi:hypothetical protein